jgi:hypothetical protein
MMRFRTNPHGDPAALLRGSLRGNAAFSALSGLACLVAAGPLSVALGVPDPRWLAGLGVNLVAFAGLLGVLAARRPIHLPSTWIVVALDLLWVVGTVPLVLADGLTRTGNLVAVAVADVVLVLALLQYLGIRRLRAPRAAAAARA